MASESTASQQAQEFLTPSPVLPRLMKTPVAVHPLPQGGEGIEFPRSPLEAGWIDRQHEKGPQLPRIPSACAERHSQPDAICFGQDRARIAQSQHSSTLHHPSPFPGVHIVGHVAGMVNFEQTDLLYLLKCCDYASGFRWLRRLEDSGRRRRPCLCRHLRVADKLSKAAALQRDKFRSRQCRGVTGLRFCTLRTRSRAAPCEAFGAEEGDSD